MSAIRNGRRLRNGVDHHRCAFLHTLENIDTPRSIAEVSVNELHFAANKHGTSKLCVQSLNPERVLYRGRVKSTQNQMYTVHDACAELTTASCGKVHMQWVVVARKMGKRQLSLKINLKGRVHWTSTGGTKVVADRSAITPLIEKPVPKPIIIE